MVTVEEISVDHHPVLLQIFQSRPSGGLTDIALPGLPFLCYIVNLFEKQFLSVEHAKIISISQSGKEAVAS